MRQLPRPPRRKEVVHQLPRPNVCEGTKWRKNERRRPQPPLSALIVHGQQISSAGHFVDLGRRITRFFGTQSIGITIRLRPEPGTRPVSAAGTAAGTSSDPPAAIILACAPSHALRHAGSCDISQGVRCHRRDASGNRVDQLETGGPARPIQHFQRSPWLRAHCRRIHRLSGLVSKAIRYRPIVAKAYECWGIQRRFSDTVWLERGVQARRYQRGLVIGDHLLVSLAVTIIEPMR